MHVLNTGLGSRERKQSQQWSSPLQSWWSLRSSGNGLVNNQVHCKLLELQQKKIRWKVGPEHGWQMAKEKASMASLPMAMASVLVFLHFCSCPESYCSTKRDPFENSMLIIPSVCFGFCNGFHSNWNKIHNPVIWPLTIVHPHLPLSSLLHDEPFCCFSSSHSSSMPLGPCFSFLLQYSLSSHFPYMSAQLPSVQRGLP